MTPQEFADAHGLSLEEAHLILEKRNRPAPDPNSRLAKARAVSEAANRKVGARPVLVNEDGIVQGPVPEEDLEKFYANKGQVSADSPKRFGDWEEPP